AMFNLLTKQVSTSSGTLFTCAFFTLFTVSQRIARKKRETAGLDQFQLIQEQTINLESLQVRPAPVLVTIRGYKTLQHLRLALEETDTSETDIVVMTARIIQGTRAGYRDIFEEHLFTDYEQLLFTKAVSVAEKMGKPVKLLTVTSNNPFSAVVDVAVRLGCTRMYVGASEKLSVNVGALMDANAGEELEDQDQPKF